MSDEKSKYAPPYVLEKAGYSGLGVKNEKLLILLHHKPCGGAVFDPVGHDPVCPANNYGRVESLITELQ